MPFHSEQSADTVCAAVGPIFDSAGIGEDESVSLAASPMSAILTIGPVGGHLLRLAAPMATGMLAVILLHLMDAFFVGRLGTEALAAMGFTFPVVMAVGSVAVGLGVGASAVISHAVGRGQLHPIRQLTTDGLLLSLAIVVPLVMLGLMTIDPLFRLLGADEKTLPLIRLYMRIWYPGMIFLVVPMVGNNALRASGQAYWPSALTILSAGANIVLDPLLIFGLWGLPEMGIAGAAVAATIARAGSLAGSLWILHSRMGMLTFSLPNPSGILESWKRILSIALPAMAAAVIIPISSAILTAIMAQWGPAAVAGFGVAVRIESLVMAALYALSASLVPFLGQNFGAGRIRRMGRAVQLSLIGCGVWGLMITAVLWPAARPISRLFNPHLPVIEPAALYLQLVPGSFALQGFALVAVSALNAIGRPRMAAGLTALRTLCLTIPLAWLGGRWAGPYGIFTAIALANTLMGMVSLLPLRRWLAIRSR